MKTIKLHLVARFSQITMKICAVVFEKFPILKKKLYSAFQEIRRIFPDRRSYRKLKTSFIMNFLWCQYHAHVIAKEKWLSKVIFFINLKTSFDLNETFTKKICSFKNFKLDCYQKLKTWNNKDEWQILYLLCPWNYNRIFHIIFSCYLLFIK